MTRYLVRHGNYSKVIEAESAEAAALEACRTVGSVLHLVAGAEYHVSPIEFERTVRVQYENPTADGEMARMPNYGRPRIVEEFTDTPERHSWPLASRAEKREATPATPETD